MHEWDPATDAEAAMRDALAVGDQDLYFRILARTELLLPVSMEALAGRAPFGWGTWTTGNRTHVLAFTSPTAFRLCLNDPGGTYRPVPFHTLAMEWPNPEWWLAVNPGLPIEAYLPAWFIAQLTRSGEVILPGRPSGNRARMAQSDLAAAVSGRIRASSAGRADYRSYASDGGHRQDPRYSDRGYGDRYASDWGYANDWGHAGRGYASEYDYAGGYQQERGYAADQGYADRGYADRGYADRGYASERGWDSRAERPSPFRPPVAIGSAPAPLPVQPVDSGQSDPGGADTTTPVETVDAEIIDVPSESRTDAAPGASAPYGGASATARPDVDEATTRFGRDLGARLREHQEAAAKPSSTSPASWTPRQAKIQDAEIVSPAEAWAVGFVPANETESSLLSAAETNNTDSFLSTLLLARVVIPVPISMPPGSRPRDKYFPWQIEEVDGQRVIAVFTSPQRLNEYAQGRFGPEMSSMSMRFTELIGAWPNPKIQFSVNPGTPVGATLPGSQIVALAAWAAEVGLRTDEPIGAELAASARKQDAASLGVAGAPTAGAAKAITMQRTVPPAQLPFYLERGYDRVSGFVNRASEVAHLTTPRALYRALGLLYKGSPFSEDDTEVHVLRWVAHRPDLYRLPYGGQNEAAMRAMQGWVIERAPFRGNGFAPGDTDVVAEFKVDSVRLPHGAQMWRLGQDGSETLVASFDADAGRWVPAP